ncbi:MAG TPA: TIM44-like domain-containing protein [Rhodopila sp.]|uniref:Tim44 domain-containing protein n=1 Tax=Rhodopila sp. TaxID=2480087 RepID=UPI002BC5FED0|nr:TIM44-like domain-containing protein [Rhodopila sp.]HVY15383.1 TIM44-like domain-containing protein [Rhodopila sp.]
MPRIRSLMAVFLALALIAMPGLALARAGSGSSFGSRGSMTYSAPPSTQTAPYSAAPMQRSMTPNTPSYGSHGYNQPYGQSSFGGGGFMSGLMGGLIGAGIGGLLFGHGFFGGGMHGFGFIGFLFQLLLIYWIGKFLFRTFFGSQPLTANGPNLFARGGMAGPVGGGGGFGGRGPAGIQIGPADYQQFEQLLKGIQAAWSAQDLNALRAMATPEMVGYFNEQLSEQASRGVRNTVSDVTLVSGDLAQAWAEGGREYATVAMRFQMIDVTLDNTGRVVDGSPSEHVTATEIWTFVRSAGGHWVLSAIQQAR